MLFMNLIDTLFRVVVKPLFRKVTYPSLFELSTIGYVSTEVSEILQTINHSSSNSEVFFQEFQELKKDLSLRYNKNNLNYPETYRIADSSALLIYSMVRIFQPDTVLETGVANGISSYYILNALSKNNKGMLQSMDIDFNVGELLQETERGRWRLNVIHKSSANADFKNVVSSLPKIDIFIHDSDHSYMWQMLEYETVYEKIRDDGVLASDDVDFSYAFEDFCLRNQYRPSFLVTPTKIFGLIKKGTRQKSIA